MANNIHYWEAVESAWNRMRAILFNPFSLEKWMVMGFAAWIAGGSAGSGSGGSGNSSGGNPLSDLDLDPVINFWHENGPMIILISAILIVLITALSVAFSWLHARGRFIFLDNVLNNRPAIVEPWKQYRKQGNSLFLWNLAFGLIGLLVTLLILGMCLPLIIALLSDKTLNLFSILGIFGAGLLMLLYSIPISFLQMLVNEFIVPVMRRHDLRIREAWSYFMPIFKPAIGTFILYALMLFAINMIIGLVVFAGIFITCCCILIPYIGTVILLPVHVFRRLISIEFLQQLGENMGGSNPLIPPLPPELTSPEPESE